MSSAKITISIDKGVLKNVDRLVKAHGFHSRSEFIQTAVREKIARKDRSRLARECSKLEKAVEQALADEGLCTEGEKNRLAWAANERFTGTAIRRGIEIEDVFGQLEDY